MQRIVTGARRDWFGTSNKAPEDAYGPNVLDTTFLSDKLAAAFKTKALHYSRARRAVNFNVTLAWAEDQTLFIETVQPR